MSPRPLAIVTVAAALLVGGCATSSWIFRAPPSRGGTFPDAALTPPPEAKDREYLGLSPGATSFSLRQLKAEAVIVEVLDMYCPYCQKAAPQAEAIFSRISSLGLAGRVKVVAIALGNSQFEADTFRDRFGTPFPIVPDPGHVVRDALGRVPKPSFYGLVAGPDGLRVITRQSGMFVDRKPEEFVTRTLAKAGVRVPAGK